MTTAVMPTLTLRHQPESTLIELVSDGIIADGVLFPRISLGLIDGVRLVPGGSDDPNVVAVIGAPDGVEDFTFDAQLADQVIQAVLRFHLAGRSAKVVDNVNDREFYARVFRAEGLRDRDELITASTLEELQRKPGSSRTHGHHHDKYDIPLPGRGFPLRPNPTFGGDDLFRGLFDREYPLRPGSLFSEQDKPDLFDVLLGGAWARQNRQAEQAESALMRSFAGTEVTLKVDEDGKLHFTGEVIYGPPAEPQD